MPRRIALPALALVAAAACATLPSEGPEGVVLPSAQAGPFREIEQSELGASRAAPWVIEDDDRFTRDPSVLDLDGDPATLPAAGFFAATLHPEETPADPADPPNAIVRHDAEDGRSFVRKYEVVLEPEAAWEGGTVGAPAAIRREGGIWLYYAAAGGVGLARSADGLAFTRDDAPVLAPDPAGWEQGAVPANPGVIELPGGELRMFYEVALEGGATAIGEARSADGITWERMGAGPALGPAATPPPGEDTSVPHDDAGVGAPAPVLATSATGRALLRVYYAARSSAGRASIGLAGRLVGEEGPLDRAVGPVFGGAASAAPGAPSVVVYPEYSLLFATQPADADPPFPAVIAGVAPATVALPATAE